MLASLEFNPVFAGGAFAAFFVPGLLVALGSRKARGFRGAALVVATAAALAVIGALGAFRVHAAAFGPSHPESRTEAAPVTLVRWSWAGAVTDTGFRVIVKLTRDGAARLLVGTDSRLLGGTRRVRASPRTTPTTASSPST
jgi:hypothetical protein